MGGKFVGGVPDPVDSACYSTLIALPKRKPCSRWPQVSLLMGAHCPTSSEDTQGHSLFRHDPIRQNMELQEWSTPAALAGPCGTPCLASMLLSFHQLQNAGL